MHTCIILFPLVYMYRRKKKLLFHIYFKFFYTQQNELTINVSSSIIYVVGTVQNFRYVRSYYKPTLVFVDLTFDKKTMCFMFKALM